jgi:hypothetical protein
VIKLSEKISKVIEGFHLPSYYAGVTFAFAEVVDLGCKRLAFSSPYTEEEFKVMWEPTKTAADDRDVPLYVERDLLVTKLFPADIAKDRVVILIAHDQSVIDEYLELKKLKEKSDSQGNPEKIENEIAWKLGELLSYDKEKIEQLINRNS